MNKIQNKEKKRIIVCLSDKIKIKFDILYK